jgi:VWFA-related protein
MPWRSLWHSMLALLLLQISTGQNKWEEKNQAGEKAYQEGRLADASALFTEALREVQKFGPKDVRLAPIYNNLALISFVQNNFIASEILYEKAIAVMEAQGQENPLLLPVLDNLTSLYVKQWAFGKAIRTSWRAYKIREKKFGPGNLETAAGLNKLATLYLDCVRLLPQSPSDKFPPPEHARDNPSKKSSGFELQGLSASMEDAQALDDAAKLAIAESLFGRVLEVQEKAFGDKNTRLVDVLENLGQALQAQGKVGAAEGVYARAITILEKSFGPDDLRLAIPLQQMAELRAEDGDFADAEGDYRHALRIDESKAGGTDPSLRVVLMGYATLLEKMHRSEEAKNLTDRARSLAAPRTLNIAIVADSVPYILRFEKSVYDRYTGVQQTCILIRTDGRFRVEEQHQERPDRPVTVQVLRTPDGMPELGGPLQEKLADRSDTGSHAPKIFESSLDGDAVQQLRAILSAKEIRDIQGSYPRRGEANYYSTEKITASVLRDDGVQNFAFPDTSARQPYEGGLKPLFKWLSTAEKRKGAVVQGATQNNCSPDTPKAVPMRFSSSREKTAQNVDTAVASESAANQRDQDVIQDMVSTVKVHVNTVLVRVVVRNAQGRALGTLRQEDFRLLDDGKPRVIAKFSLEQLGEGMGAEPKVSDATSGAVAPGSAGTAKVVERSVAYLFDDIHLSAVDLGQVRSAADHHLSSLQPAERAAIFTTSGETSLDFTDDRTKLRESLFRIHPRQVVSSAGNNCPDIDTYMADLIWNKHDEDALGAAAVDALACAYGGDPRMAEAAEHMAKVTAQQQVASAEMQGRIILGAFQTALRRLAAAPGQHVLVVVSPGFFVAQGHGQDFGQLIDYALHSDIIINTLDARGLYQVNSLSQISTETLQYRRESASANGEILMTLSNATGGALFHNSNDFAKGFSRVAESPEYYYVLGFSPPDQELDGRFHNLTLALNGGEKLTLQARKGYYARKQ